MKKLLFIFIIIFFGTVNITAQPNIGFDHWTPEFSYENPDGWQTGNFMSLLTPPDPISATKVIGSDAYSGLYSLKIKTVYLINNPFSTQLHDTTGAVFTGKINLAPFSYKYGFPYTGRPQKLEFWSKYFPVGNDTAECAVALQKWNGSGHDTIGGGRINICSNAEYTHFQVDLTYISTALPDTAAIIFMSSKNANCGRVNSTLYLDDVLFTGWVGINESNTSGKDKVKAFPNPAKGSMNIETQIKDAYIVRVRDSSGKLAGIYRILNNSISINTSLFSTGVYFYDIIDKKEKVLFNGKFSVIK